MLRLYTPRLVNQNQQETQYFRCSEEEYGEVRGEGGGEGAGSHHVTKFLEHQIL